MCLMSYCQCVICHTIKVCLIIPTPGMLFAFISNVNKTGRIQQRYVFTTNINVFEINQHGCIQET